MALIAVLCAILGSIGNAQALDKVRAGKSIGSLWAFLPLDIGVEQGLFAKYGIEVEISDLGSGAKLQQALASDSIDVGLSAGSDMMASVKGSPVLTVAAFAEEPRSVVIMVGANSPIQKPADFKGKLVAMPSLGSVSEWLLRRMAIAEGLGRDGVRMVSQGSVQANLAALRTGQIDGMIGPMEVGFSLEDKHEGRIAVHLAQYAPHFHAHILFARKQFIADKPDVLARFLKGFFAAVKVMKTDKKLTSETAIRVLHSEPSIADRTYDAQVGMLIDDGHFDPQAITLIKESWVELGMLDKEPSDEQFMTTKFVPVKE
ncbi:MAG TPA: ABC transporter substrate-binding protein [Stellaceae bacterium]|jgi:NitT/TauT family transport system substrate-binding protein|nr:ABC transporter substrate-binding protein [Stellaceae bacterium]